MARTVAFALAISLALSSTAALAQKNGPLIIPERMQELAAKTQMAERLGIKWGSASEEDVGRYVGLLAAATVVADKIAHSNDRKVPSDADDEAALAVFCIVPPNKPPKLRVAEPFWPRAMAAFDNESTRTILRAAVGRLATDLPKQFLAGNGAEIVLKTWPTNKEQYFKQVLDFGALDSGK